MIGKRMEWRAVQSLKHVVMDLIPIRKLFLANKRRGNLPEKLVEMSNS